MDQAHADQQGHLRDGLRAARGVEPFPCGQDCRADAQIQVRRNLIEADALPDTINGGELSRKPVEMRQMIEQLLPQRTPARHTTREQQAGNDVWGNEITRIRAAG